MITMAICSVNGDNEAYRREKAASTLGKPKFTPDVIRYSKLGNAREPKLLARENWPALDAPALQEIEKRIACFINDVNKESPLLEGEKVVSDFVSILTEEYHDHLPGTPVLKRKTNQADLYYFSRLAMVEPDGTLVFRTLREEPAAVLHSKAPMMVGLGASSVASELLMSLAKGLVGELGKGIGAQLLVALFPSGQQIDYKALLDDLAKIVKDANTEQTVNECGGKINGVISYIRDYYKRRKDDPRVPKTELYNLLSSQNAELSKVLGILKMDQFKEKGLATLVSGVQVCFSLYQEMALEDPVVDNPLNSSNILSLSDAVTEYTDFLRPTIQAITDRETNAVNDHLSKITGVYDNAWCDIQVCKDRYCFRDDQTGYFSNYYEQCGKNDHPEARAQQARDAYYNQVRSRLDEVHGTLIWMLSCANEWQKLHTHPLPMN